MLLEGEGREGLLILAFCRFDKNSFFIRCAKFFVLFRGDESQLEYMGRGGHSAIRSSPRLFTQRWSLRKSRSRGIACSLILAAFVQLVWIPKIKLPQHFFDAAARLFAFRLQQERCVWSLNSNVHGIKQRNSAGVIWTNGSNLRDPASI